MDEIRVGDLQARTADILRRIREQGASYAVLDDDGVVVARLAHAEPSALTLGPEVRARLDALALRGGIASNADGAATDDLALLAHMELLAQQMAADSPSEVSAVDAVRDQRR